MTQCEMIVKYMEEFGSISPLEAVNTLGCMRLSSRIHDLKKQGYNIETKTVSTWNRYGKKTNYAVYRLKED